MPFFSISASEFVEVFAGVGASRVRDLRPGGSLFYRPCAEVRAGQEVRAVHHFH